MRMTSIKAFRSITPVKLGQRQQQVLEAIEEYAPVCDREISKYTKLPINVVTPRRGELFKKKLVTVDYLGFDITGRQVTYWKLSNSNEN